MAVYDLYVRNHIREDSITAVVEMINRTQNEYENMLKGADWMDDETREAALKKIHAMSMGVGYPEEMTNRTMVDNKYKNVQIDRNSFLRSSLSIKKALDCDAKYDQLHKLYLEYHDSFLNPNTVNAFYSPPINRMSKRFSAINSIDLYISFLEQNTVLFHQIVLLTLIFNSQQS